MSYAEHGPRIFLMGGSDSGASMIYGDYVLPKQRLEGRLKLYDSCTDIRAWSPNFLESSRYFRELSEHAPDTPGKVVPFNVIIESMIGITAQAENELHIAQRELRKYKSLKLTPEQQKYLEGFEKARLSGEIRIEPIMRPLCQEKLFRACRLASLQPSDTCLSIYFRPDNRFLCDKRVHSLLTDTGVPRESRNADPLSRGNAYLVSRVTSCNILTEVKATQECSNQTSVCELVEASSQTVQDVREVHVQTDRYRDTGNYDEQLNIDSSSSHYYENSESIYVTESESEVNLDPQVCDMNHEGVIIQKDSEIIVLKNELDMKEEELDELQMLLKKKDDNENILKHNFNILQEQFEKLTDEVKDLREKLFSSKCLTDKLQMELGRRYKICYSQSQKIQKQAKEADILLIENESLGRKVEEMDQLLENVKGCDIALEQVLQERNMLQKKYSEQSCILAHREDEIKQLSTFINQMHEAADTREVEMNRVVADLRNEIQAKPDKIAQCETRLVCMERKVSNLTSMLKNSLNNLDESKIAYEGICEYAKCEHDTCLDVQSASAVLRAFIVDLEECKLDRRNRLREIANLKACVACYSQESVSEITNTDFDTGQESIQPTADDISSSNYGDRHSSKELVSVQVQSDEVETTTEECSERSEKLLLNEVISNEEIDRALTMHMKRSIDKISSILQGTGDHHAQIVKEHAKQQQELQRKDLEITELKQKVADQMLRRGEGDCMIQEQVRKKVLEKEKMLKAVISQRDSKIGELHEHLNGLENYIDAYRVECDKLKSENYDLVDTKNALSKANEEQNEELRAQRDQMCKLIQQMNDLKLTIDTLKEEANSIDDMRKQLIDLQMKNDDLTNRLLQANETIFKNDEVVTDLKRKDELNRMTLTDSSIRYDAMITQKYNEIMKLQDENQSLRDQLREAEIKLARNNDVISLLRREDDNAVDMGASQTNLSDKDKEKPLMVDSLRTEIASCENFTNVGSELQKLLCENETLKGDAEIVRNDDQLLHEHEDTIKRPLKDVLYTLPGKIYEQILRLRGESKGNEGKENVDEQFRGKEITSENEYGEIKQQTEVHADKSCQQDEEFYMRQCDELDSAGYATVDGNFKSAAHKLRFLERRHEEKLQEIKTLMGDVKLRDYEIKNLQECITYLLQEKNDLQTKVTYQVEEYQSKLTLLKKKYDSSLDALRNRHNENVERLQTRFEDIMKIERSPFDAESWLQSLDSKELTELHNRIDILSTHATANRESDTHAEAKNHNGRQSDPEETAHRNRKFTLHKEKCAPEDRTPTSRKSKECATVNADNTEKVDVTDLYSRSLKYKQEYRMKQRSVHTKSPAVTTLDWQREKFIYQCSIYHSLSNVR